MGRLKNLLWLLAFVLVMLLAMWLAGYKHQGRLEPNHGKSAADKRHVLMLARSVDR